MIGYQRDGANFFVVLCNGALPPAFGLLEHRRPINTIRGASVAAAACVSNVAGFESHLVVGLLAAVLLLFLVLLLLLLLLLWGELERLEEGLDRVREREREREREKGRKGEREKGRVVVYGKVKKFKYEITKVTEFFHYNFEKHR